MNGSMRCRTTDSAYVCDLMKVYETYDNYIGEVVFFVEQVTGHVIPDFRGVLKYGVKELLPA